MRTAFQRFVTKRRQRGVALLALTTLVVVVSAGAVLDSLAELVTGAEGQPDQDTVEALVEAKAALLYYAATASTRPGELPCPDVDYDGEATEGVDFTAAAGKTCATYRGWLPFETLDMTELLDTDDERLRYGLSSDFHTGGPVQLNSDTAGQLTLDGSGDDVVAAIIAARGPIDSDCLSQDDNRPAIGDTHNAVANVAAYLESDNANGNLTTYVSDANQCTDGTETINDQLITITRAELMAVVEKRVLGDIAQVLESYRDAGWNGDGVYPWLTVLGDPGASAFKSSVGTSVGYLSYHQPNESFSTILQLTWSITNADVIATGTVTPAHLASGTVNSSATGNSCIWGDETTVNCTAVTSRISFCGVLPNQVAIQRTYQVQFTGVTVDVSPPDSGDHRRRQLSILEEHSMSSNDTDVSLTITDTYSDGEGGTIPCGAGTLANNPSTDGTISAGYIRYELALDDELPSWIIDQNWHHYLYVAVSPAAKPGGSGLCDDSDTTDCLTLSGMTPSSDKQALVVAAGAALDWQTRGSWGVSEYYELDNISYSDGTYEKASSSDSFNDQIRVITP